MKVSNKTGLILLGLGALALYKYTKLTDEEKDELKEKAKKFYDDNINPLIKNALGLVDDVGEAVEQHGSIK